MIYKLYKGLGVALDKDTALLLYVGMLTDTGSFHYSNTTPVTHKIVSELLSFNIDVAGIYKKVYQNLPFEDMQLLMAILPTMRYLRKGEILWLQISKDLLKNRTISFDLTEQILTLARTINNVEVIVLFKEALGKKKEVRVNFRSQGKVDVNKVARFFGGGGHKAASGATVKGSLEEVRRKVLAKIKQSLK
jgi:phosphoesterase RecJ-like protein